MKTLLLILASFIQVAYAGTITLAGHSDQYISAECLDRNCSEVKLFARYDWGSGVKEYEFDVQTIDVPEATKQICQTQSASDGQAWVYGPILGIVGIPVLAYQYGNDLSGPVLGTCAAAVGTVVAIPLSALAGAALGVSSIDSMIKNRKIKRAMRGLFTPDRDDHLEVDGSTFFRIAGLIFRRYRHN